MATMKTLSLAGALAVAFVLGGCSTQRVASVSATPDSDVGYMNVKDGKRQESMLGSRVPREARENAESVKSMSRRAYQDAQNEKPTPMTGGM
jgi:hypothetical protein